MNGWSEEVNYHLRSRTSTFGSHFYEENSNFGRKFKIWIWRKNQIMDENSNLERNLIQKFKFWREFLAKKIVEEFLRGSKNFGVEFLRGSSSIYRGVCPREARQARQGGCFGYLDLCVVCLFSIFIVFELFSIPQCPTNFFTQISTSKCWINH